MKKYVVVFNMSAERINRIMDKGWKLERITKLGTYVFEKVKKYFG